MNPTESLWGAFRKSKSSDVSIRNQLVEANKALARKIAHRAQAECAEPYDDLEQLAMIGLMKAIAKFDPTRGVAFSSFAVPYIRGEILHFLRDHWGQVKVPRRTIELKSKVKRNQKKMRLMGVEMDETQIALGLGVSDAKWRQTVEMCDRKPLMQLDEVLHPSIDDDDVEQEYAWVRSSLAKLANPHRVCIELKMFGQLSESAIAKQQNTTPEQVKLWISEGLERIKEDLRAKGMGT